MGIATTEYSNIRKKIIRRPLQKSSARLNNLTYLRRDCGWFLNI